MRQILAAVHHCHQNKIMHRDLKPENILFTRADRRAVQLCNFGSSTAFDVFAVQTEIVGSPYYVAPEVLNRSYGPKCDIWSCGVICFVLLTGKAPFSGDSLTTIGRKIKKGKFVIPNHVSREA